MKRRAPGTKPKVVILGKLPPPYIGPAIATQVLLRSTLRDDFALLHVNTAADVSLHALGQWRLRKFWQFAAMYGRLLRLLLAERPALVLLPISQTTPGFLKDSVFILLSRSLRVPTLLQLRGSNFQNWLRGASRPVQAYVARMLRATQGMIVQGEALRSLFAGFYPDERIFVAPNGADYTLPPVEKHGPLRALYLSNLQASKGVEDVVEAALLARERHGLDFRLDVVGAWRDEAVRQRCEALVARHGLPVTFHGPAYDEAKLAHYARADVFVYPPRGPQGHSWVLVEAMAAGLPIVATDWGTTADAVHEGRNGFLVASERPDEIAERLCRLAEPALRRRMGAAGRALYEQLYTEERMVAHFRQAFDAVLALEGRPRAAPEGTPAAEAPRSAPAGGGVE